MNTINKTLDNGWKIEAEHDGEKYHLYLESRCGDYYGSLAMAEDTGHVENSSAERQKKVPQSVLKAAQELEDNLWEEQD